MRFSVSSVSSVSSDKSALKGPRSAWRDQFLCGGILLLIGGWIAAHPLPKAPNLPSACQARISAKIRLPTEAPVEKQILVWVDTRSGIYYFPESRRYGRTSHGMYLGVKSARARGYQSSARR